VAGFGAAAYGAVSPIVKAAGAAGGLRANMAKLNPEQRGLALSILGLGKQYDQFSKSLQPEVLSVFGKGIALAGDLMHEVQPVASATGKAIGGLLDKVDAEFKSGTWQSFFSFMAKTAGPDIALLGNTFTGLLNVLPPLLTDLQPVATTLLGDADAALKLAGAILKVYDAEHGFIKTTSDSTGWLGRLGHAAGNAFDQLIPGTGQAKQLGKEIGIFGTQASGPGVKGLNAIAAAAAPAATQLQMITAALTTLDNLLSDQSAQVAWKQSQIAATKAVDAGSKAIDGNSAKQLANRQLVIDSTQKTEAFANIQATTGHDIDGASRTLANQIKFLQSTGDKSRWVTAQIHDLQKAENALKNRSLMINVDGRGQYSVQAIAAAGGHGGSQRLLGGARGMLVQQGTTATADDVLVRVSKGESIVPAHLTPAVAPLLKAHGVPGFAQGVVGNYGPGSLAGLGSWMTAENSATLRAIEQATAAGALRGIKAAQSAASGGGGFGGGLGRASLRQIENWWVQAGGPGGGYAHVAAAITGAESGFNPRAVQAGQPYATTGWGLWQITPGNSEPQFGTDSALLNPLANAGAAVAKFHAADGFSPWTTFMDGAYLKFMARGGTAAPGWTVLGERGPELAFMRGGETVLSHSQSVQAGMGGLPGLAGGTLTPKQAAALAARQLKTEESTGASLANYYAHPGTAAGIRAEETRYLKAIARYFDGSSAKWRDKAVERQTARLTDVGSQIRSLGSRLAGARSYQQSVQSGLSGFADLSTTTLGGAMIGNGRGGQSSQGGARYLNTQLQGKLGSLKKFGQVLGKLAAAKVDSSLIRQVVALGQSDPVAGAQYGQEILSGGPSLIRALNKTEAGIAGTELNISRGAASSVYEGKYQPGKHFLQELQHDKSGLQSLFRDLGKTLGEEASRWFRVPKGRRPKGFASGGVLTEPVYGYGASGQEYTFAENGPERITPGAGRSGPLVTFGDVHVREQADIHIISQRVGFAIAAAGLG
jgi:hypothetical protein